VKRRSSSSSSSTTTNNNSNYNNNSSNNSNINERTVTPENGRGNLKDRIKFMRNRLESGLGRSKFDVCYEYLKNAQELPMDDGRVQVDLGRILGRELLHFGGLMDQLVFMENV